jgi:hypothetical protein
LWSGFGGGCQNNNDGDPIVQYDKVANRWILTQFSVSTTPYLQCVAVSTTSDATGSYYRYSFSYGNGFNDYPKLGVWPDGYYITFNIFNNGQTFAGSKLCAYDRTSMLNGATATQQCFQLSNSYGGVLPSDPLGTMQAETILQSGGGSQLTNLSRWGDYSAMTVDPADDCTFWYTSEYLKSSGTFNWSTKIASFKFPGCQ